jgi:DNA repair protein RadD
MYTLRPYQQEAVDKTIEHFRKTVDPAVVVLPTGAGKSLVIAELAKIAKGRVLVLAHVKELVEQNHAKYESYELEAGIYSAGLNRKDHGTKVIFGSIQSVARAQDSFFEDFSLVIIDECHRVAQDGQTQYQQVIEKLRENSKRLCVLGLTATPYRLGLGWIYNFHYKGKMRSDQDRFFKKCIYELPLSYMIKNGYLTPPIKVDAPVACYDFSALDESGHTLKEIEKILYDQSRVTPGIIGHIMEEADERQGVMIFASTVKHAREILTILPKENSVIVTGETPQVERDEIIVKFKDRDFKYLVNVSVLTTGFDAPHVDLIAVLRPTESVSLYQQIVGRGLRLSEGKDDCLILDYTGQDHNLFSPEVGEERPAPDTEAVEVLCPECGITNIFWGRRDELGNLVEHFGRKCQGAHENDVTGEIERCDYRYRFKECDKCGCENDIAARNCRECDNILADPDKKLKEAMQLKDAHIMRPDSMYFFDSPDKKGNQRLEIRYYDYDGEHLSEFFYMGDYSSNGAFFHGFVKRHLKNPGVMEKKLRFDGPDCVINNSHLFRMPKFVIARHTKRFWKIREKIFIE